MRRASRKPRSFNRNTDWNRSFWSAWDVGAPIGDKWNAATHIAYCRAMRLRNAKRITDTIREILELTSFSPLYSGSQICRIDIPKVSGYTFDWHQEVFYQIPKSRFVQTWGPLVSDIKAGFGALEVLVGSHKEGVARQVWNINEGIPDQILVTPDVVAKYPVKVVELKVGQILFFSGKTIHKSGIHTHPGTRYTLVGSYHDVDNPDFLPDQGVKPSGFTARDYYEEERIKWGPVST